MRSLVLLFTLAFFSTSVSAQSSFDYLDVKGNKVEVTHAVKYTLKIDKSFRLLGETHRRATFDNKGFNVSLVSFARGDSFLMVQAEAHTDGSGGLDYSNMTADKYGGIPFTSREQCAGLSKEDIKEEHDLGFLNSHGFDPLPALYLKQYFTTSKDGTAELVISYGQRVPACNSEVITPAFKKHFGRESRKHLTIAKHSK